MRGPKGPRRGQDMASRGPCCQGRTGSNFRGLWLASASAPASSSAQADDPVTLRRSGVVGFCANSRVPWRLDAPLARGMTLEDRRRTLMRWFLATVWLAVTVSGAAAQDYPTRLVTIVAPSAPGGLYSLFARIIADRLEQRLGQTFLVENRPGAASVVGAVAVARAPADGYTLMVASGATLAVNVTLHRALPYDPLADFVPIALIARVPEVLVVDPALPVHSLADLATLAKSQPLTFASAGAGTG